MHLRCTCNAPFPLTPRRALRRRVCVIIWIASLRGRLELSEGNSVVASLLRRRCCVVVVVPSSSCRCRRASTLRGPCSTSAPRCAIVFSPASVLSRQCRLTWFLPVSPVLNPRKTLPSSSLGARAPVVVPTFSPLTAVLTRGPGIPVLVVVPVTFGVTRSDAALRSHLGCGLGWVYGFYGCSVLLLGVPHT